MITGLLYIGSSGEASEITLTRIYDNVPKNPALATRWGTASLIEGLDKTILFDTGGLWAILLSNMRELGINPETIDVVVLSHIHSDHTGGLEGLLRVNDHLCVYLPAPFPQRIKKRIAAGGADVIEVDGPVKICDRAFSTGTMGTFFKEQALVIESEDGIIVITGCSHPGVENFVSRAMEITGGRVYFVTGGFHLGLSTSGRIRGTVDQLKRMNVRKVGPSHCTGKRAMQIFRDEWGEDFVDMGCGARFSVKGAREAHR